MFFFSRLTSQNPLWRLIAMIRKEFIHLRRDPYSLAILLVEPIVLLLVVAYGLSTDVRHLPMAVQDASRSAASRALVRSYDQTEFYDVHYWVEDESELAHLLDSGRAKVGLVIPPDYGDKVMAGETANVQLLVDGSDPSIAISSQYHAALIAQDHAAELSGERLGGQALLATIDLRSRILYNPAMENVVFMTPGLVAVLLVYITLAMSGFAIVREREHGTMEQLMVTPIKPLELMIGKILPYALVSLIDAGLMLLTAIVMFRIPVRGSLLLLAGSSVVFIGSMLAMGLLISSVARTQYEALQWVIFLLVPPVMLSGLMFPIEGMPPAVQQITRLIPLTYFLRIVRGLLIKGNGLALVWRDTGILAAFGLVLMIFSVMRFQKRLD